LYEGVFHTAKGARWEGLQLLTRMVGVNEKMYRKGIPDFGERAQQKGKGEKELAVCSTRRCGGDTLTESVIREMKINCD